MAKGTEKPVVNLIGANGNAFAIMGACSRAAKKAGWTAEEIKEYYDNAMKGDYDFLLRVTQEYFDVQ